MIIFDPIIVGSLFVLASTPVCSMPKLTEINVMPTSKPVQYDYSQRLQEIQHQVMTTANPYANSKKSYTQGYMKGLININPEVTLGYMMYNNLGVSCLWYDKIDIRMDLTPTIVVAREVYQDKCMHRAVVYHEKKHVRADRNIINKYSKKMAEEIYKTLKRRGFKSSVVQNKRIKLLREDMNKVVFDVVNQQYKKMEAERRQVQQAIDTREEYRRVSSQCPHFNPSKHLLFPK